MSKKLKAVLAAAWKATLAGAQGWAKAKPEYAAGLAFAEKLREELGKLGDEERARIAREILEANVEDLLARVSDLERITRDQFVVLVQLVETLALLMDDRVGGLPSREELEDLLRVEIERGVDRMAGRMRGLFDQARVDGENARWKEFEERYLEYLKNTYSRLRVIGVRELRHVHQPLSVAFVSLRVRRAEGSGTAFETAERTLRRHPLLTVRGPAGSGKTTLMHWLMVQCADHKDEENPWRGGVPFFIPLRKVAAEGRSSPDFLKFVEYGHGENAFDKKPPEGWISTILEQQRGIVLLDGLDELPPDRRPDFWEWLHGFLKDFPKNRICITSRPFGGSDDDGEDEKEKLWDPPREFRAAELEDMTDADIQIFVERWHDAVLKQETDPEDRAVLKRHRKELPDKLTSGENRRVRAICRTPLLCSMVCALHWRDEGYLPTKRIDLYDRCCSMLIDERDRKRALLAPPPPYCHLTREDKEMLLQRLALDMMRNKTGDREGDYAIEVTRAEAIEWIEPNLMAVEDARARDCGVPYLLDHVLIERTGLLRKPVEGSVDFPHRTFQEYLAACAAGAVPAAGELAKHAEDDQWRETIILAAGTKTGGVPFGRELIEELLRRGADRRVPPRARLRCLAVAVACLQTARQLDAEIVDRVLSYLEEITPPRNREDAGALSAAGRRVVRHLAYEKVKDEEEGVVAACARTLALVACEDALRELREGYGTDKREEVLAGVCAAPGIEPLELPAVLKRVKRWLLPCIPTFARPYVRSLEPLRMMTELTKLEVGDFLGGGCPLVADLSPLSVLANLGRLDLTGCTGVTDLSPVSTLTKLGRLDLIGCTGVTDLSPLSALAKLESLHLIGCTEVTEISSLSGLKLLKVLDLTNCSGVIDLSALGGLEKLERLHLGRCKGLTDLWPLSGLEKLEGLVLSRCTGVTDLWPLSGLEKLAELDLEGCTGVRDLSPLSGLEKLVVLSLRGCTGVMDLSPLSGLAKLEALDLMGCTGVRDLSPVEKLPRLKDLIKP